MSTHKANVVYSYACSIMSMVHRGCFINVNLKFSTYVIQNSSILSSFYRKTLVVHLNRAYLNWVFLRKEKSM